MPPATQDGQECPKIIAEARQPVRSDRVRLKMVQVRGLVQPQLPERLRTMLRVRVDQPITTRADLSLRGREPITTTLADRNLRGRERKIITLGREPKITTPGRDRLDQALRTTHLRPAAQQYRGQVLQGTMLGQMQLHAPELQTISQAADRWLLDRGPRITIPHLDSLRRTTAPIVGFRVRLLGGRTSRKDVRAM
jgi:hypothetical protein